MARPLRHWWGVGFPPEFRLEVPSDPLGAGRGLRCEGEVQRLYVRKTFDGRAGWHVVGLVCLGCGVTSIDEDALAALDPESA